jgi:hypothetical protein
VHIFTRTCTLLGSNTTEPAFHSTGRARDFFCARMRYYIVFIFTLVGVVLVTAVRAQAA